MSSDRKVSRLIREGAFVAEVEVTRIPNDDGWGAYYSAADTRKMDDVRLALRRGDLKAAAKLARIYELMPVTAE